MKKKKDTLLIVSMSFLLSIGTLMFSSCADKDDPSPILPTPEDTPYILKLKFSVGQQGNDRIDDFLYVDTYNINNSNNELSLGFSRKGNKNITWETNTNINLGIEFELLKGRLSGSIEYFNRRTTDMLNRFSVPLSLGYSGYYDNIGDMNNKGVEIDLKYIPVKTRNVTWNIGFNATHYRNKISRLAESKKQTL